ncbi:MAG: Succinate-semialdehyde dehydrogenase, mitochondrial [Bogoriella megaspora]|nr:MAG: Succinate-semialdehyde dehydrogenase, mitochondrial [Bogoriella megaspora]
MAANGANGSTDSVPFKLNDPSLLHQQCLIGGEWVEAKAGRRFDIIDPGTGDPFASAPIADVADAQAALESSTSAFSTYSKWTPRQRAQTILKWHELVTANKADIATLVTYETGKPYYESLGEMDYALGFTWFFAGEAERIQGAVYSAAMPGRRVLTVKQPIGVAVALVPWNFPIAMVLRKAGAALAAGCALVIKPSPETPLSVLALADLANRAGFPKGTVNVLTTDLEATPRLSEELCTNSLTAKVSFTGSTRVGRLVAAHCAKAGPKKVTMELGGNCPFVVFGDANLELAATQLMGLKWRHAGQACITANRVYVQKNVLSKFEEMMVEKTKALKVGHGMDEGVKMGPLTTDRSLPKIASHVQDARSLGARILLGGNKGTGPTDENKDKTKNGYFYEPTVLSDVNKDMLISKEETFGPLLAIYPFDTEEEVTKLANDTSMGLASYVFTQDVDRLWRMFENLEAGMIGLNTGNQSAAESPFGGIKDSGYGKESGKDVAVAEYLITKTGTLTVSDHY